MKLKYLAIFVILICGRTWALGDTYRAGKLGFYNMISAGYDNTCALDAEGLKCWGDNSFGQITVPPLKSPSQVSVGEYHTCALDAGKVKCWGADGDGQTKVPVLKLPTQVSVGVFHSCALDAEGVKCWGAKVYGQVPPLKSPSQVSAGETHTCALDAEGVKCWGENDKGQITVPPLKSPSQVSLGRYHTCALDAEGVKCWGDNSQGQTQVPVLKSPVQVSAGVYHTCALDAEGVKCWGRNAFGQTKVPSLKSPSQVSAGEKHTCALDAEGVKCWDFGQDKFHPIILNRDFVEKAIPYVNSARATYLIGFSKISVHANTEAYYLKLLLASPTILSLDSSFFIDSYLPDFKKEVRRLQKILGYTSDILEIPDAEENRKLTIVSIQSALSVSLNFISRDQQTSLQESLRVAGVVFADPMNNQKIKELLKQIDALDSEKQKLKSSPKSAFLVDSLELAANWLREKVK